MLSIELHSLIHRTILHRTVAAAASAIGLGLVTTLAFAPNAVASEPTSDNSTAADTSPSDALVTQPATASTSDLLGTQRDAIDISEEPTLIFTLEDNVLSARELIEENKPENSNAIHFPLGTTTRR
ncbi:MAG: hypothetical protein ACFB4J_10605 [Elainellaceae cyanobacterium]